MVLQVGKFGAAPGLMTFLIQKFGIKLTPIRADEGGGVVGGGSSRGRRILNCLTVFKSIDQPTRGGSSGGSRGR